jgi:hypothetical protein
LESVEVKPDVLLEQQNMMSTLQEQFQPAIKDNLNHKSPKFSEAIKFVNTIIQKEQPFTDSDFPPQMSSLANEDDSESGK